MVRFILCLLLSLAMPATAQEDVPSARLLDIPAQLHRPVPEIAEAFAVALPQFRQTPSPPLSGPGDPFLAVLEGVFGAPGARHAGLVHCARYGLETRDLLATRRASDPEIFPLVSALRAAGDDTIPWPETAIALFRCTIVWDDARRLQPWPENRATALIGPAFDDIIRLSDATVRAELGDHVRPQFGAEGFRVTGTDGPHGGYYWVQRMTVSREISHQRISFRAFLLAGMV